MGGSVVLGDDEKMCETISNRSAVFRVCELDGYGKKPIGMALFI